MRVLHAYAKSDPSRLVYKDDAPSPTLDPGDVLVRVHASGVTPSELDWPSTWLHHDGTPRTPPIVPGHEVAGLVEAVAPAAEGVSVGDEVYGLIDFRRDGADAEYVAARAAELAPKPATRTFAEATTVPLSALTAWQALVPWPGWSDPPPPRPAPCAPPGRQPRVVPTAKRGSRFHSRPRILGRA